MEKSNHNVLTWTEISSVKQQGLHHSQTKAIISKGLITNRHLESIWLQIEIGYVCDAYFVLLGFVFHILNPSPLGDNNRFY